MTTYAVVLAAGKSVRFGDRDKMFENVLGKTVLERSLETFIRHPEIARIVLVTSEESMRRVREALRSSFPDTRPSLRVIEGGATRAASSLAGLEEAAAWETASPVQGTSGRVIVLLHDAARCLVTPDLISSVIETIERHRCGVAPYVPVRDTIRLLDEPQGRFVSDTLPRDRLGAMQTPQGADLDIMLAASRIAAERKILPTDDVEVLRWVGYPVRMIPGETRNIKVTYPEDIAVAEYFLRDRSSGGD